MIRILDWLLCLLALLVVVAGQAGAAVTFEDDFTTYNPSTWVSASSLSGGYSGAPQTVEAVVVDGRTCLHLRTTNAGAMGWTGIGIAVASQPPLVPTSRVVVDFKLGSAGNGVYCLGVHELGTVGWAHQNYVPSAASSIQLRGNPGSKDLAGVAAGQWYRQIVSFVGGSTIYEIYDASNNLVQRSELMGAGSYQLGGNLLPIVFAQSGTAADPGEVWIDKITVYDKVPGPTLQPGLTVFEDDFVIYDSDRWMSAKDKWSAFYDGPPNVVEAVVEDGRTCLHMVSSNGTSWRGVALKEQYQPFAGPACRATVDFKTAPNSSAMGLTVLGFHQNSLPGWQHEYFIPSWNATALNGVLGSWYTTAPHQPNQWYRAVMEWQEHTWQYWVLDADGNTLIYRKYLQGAAEFSGPGIPLWFVMAQTGRNGEPACEAWVDKVTFEYPGLEVMSIDAVKSTADGQRVQVENVSVTAGLFGDDPRLPGDPEAPKVYQGFGVQSLDDSQAIRVIAKAPVGFGGRWMVRGTAATVDGERVIDASAGAVTFIADDVSAPKPEYMTGIAFGGGDYGMQGAVLNNAGTGLMATGLNNVGRLVKISGKVTASVYTGFFDGYFYVDDGSGLNDGSGNVGIRCRPWAIHDGTKWTVDILPMVDENVVVTGLVGVRQIGGVNTRFLWTVSCQTLF